MASADFGGPCKDMIVQKLKRRDANWRLDPALRKACAMDVDRCVYVHLTWCMIPSCADRSHLLLQPCLVCCVSAMLME